MRKPLITLGIAGTLALIAASLTPAPVSAALSVRLFPNPVAVGAYQFINLENRNNFFAITLQPGEAPVFGGYVGAANPARFSLTGSFPACTSPLPAGQFCSIAAKAETAGVATYFIATDPPDEPEEERRLRDFAIEASGQYLVNGALKEGPSSKKTVVSWGTLTLVSAAGTITCHNSISGTIENPTGKGAGKGETLAWDAYDCEGVTTCPEGTPNGVSAKDLPWSSLLEEASQVKRSAAVVKVTIGCDIAPLTKSGTGDSQRGGEGQVEGLTFEGLIAPTVQSGTSALHPGSLFFDQESGEVEDEELGAKGRIEGELKTEGYEHNELINVQ